MFRILNFSGPEADLPWERGAGRGGAGVGKAPRPEAGWPRRVVQKFTWVPVHIYIYIYIHIYLFGP